MDSGHHQAAHQFREANGAAGLEQTLHKAMFAPATVEMVRDLWRKQVAPALASSWNS